ncbi:SMI1/KNR4 family protein [Clostridium sp.]|uniref:SMI1/KNR4 family protein n=1 Tax=Clostridium sp. TaxID=1506 RepID=UPI002FC66FDE
MLGTKDIKLINKEVASGYEEYWINDILIFCELIGEGNYLGFDRRNNKYKVLDCFHEELPQSWSVISEDFDKWLELLVLNEGAKFWLN